MLTGAHAIIYSADAEADRAFFRDVLELENVDVGGGWLIFGLPPGEVAVHPSDENDMHELYLMTDDVEGLVADMNQRGVECSPITNQGWGMLTQITLPGGGKLGVYQPRHARPKSMSAGAKPRKATPKKPAKKVAKKTAKRPAKKAPAKRAKKRARR